MPYVSHHMAACFVNWYTLTTMACPSRTRLNMTSIPETVAKMSAGHAVGRLLFRVRYKQTSTQDVARARAHTHTHSLKHTRMRTQTRTGSESGNPDIGPASARHDIPGTPAPPHAKRQQRWSNAPQKRNRVAASKVDGA